MHVFTRIMICCALPLVGFAALRTSPTVVVDNGRIAQTAILADADGTVFFEFLRETHVADKLTREWFDGEILPPEIIDEPSPNPRSFTRLITAFELYGHTLTPLAFTDQHRARTKGVKLIYAPTQKPERLQLWRYVHDDERWQRVGGITEETESGDTVFLVFLDGTGTYAIYEEQPQPGGDFEPYDEDEIEQPPQHIRDSWPTPSVLPPTDAIAFYESEIERMQQIIREGQDEPEPAPETSETEDPQSPAADSAVATEPSNTAENNPTPATPLPPNPTVDDALDALLNQSQSQLTGQEPMAEPVEEPAVPTPENTPVPEAEPVPENPPTEPPVTLNRDEQQIPAALPQTGIPMGGWVFLGLMILFMGGLSWAWKNSQSPSV